MALDGTVVPARGDNNAFYREYTIAVVGTNATIPQVTLASQTDALNEKNALYSAYFYADGIEQDMFLSATLGAFQVPDTPAATDWGTLEQYNFGVQRRYYKDENTYSALLIDQKIAANLSTPTIPLVRGGSGATSSLELRSTAGVGTTDYIKLTVGNNGATEGIRLVHSGRVGVGTTAPSAQLTVSTNVTALTENDHTVANEYWNFQIGMADSIPGGMGIDTFNAFGVFDFRRANGTAASPTALQSGNIIGVIGNLGYGTTGYKGGTPQIRFYAQENWTDSAQGSYISLMTNANGTAAVGGVTERLRITDAGLIVTGGLAATLNHNATSALTITNTTSGTGALAQVAVTSDSGMAASMSSNSTGYTTIPLWAGSGSFSTGWGTLRVSAFAASGVIKLQTGGLLAGNDWITLDQAGNFVIGTAAIATNATTGFLYIPSCAGTPTGTPTTYTGRVPMVFDSSNSKLYVFSGTWKGVTVS